MIIPQLMESVEGRQAETLTIALRWGILRWPSVGLGWTRLSRADLGWAMLSWKRVELCLAELS